MANICELTGKKPMSGHKVSHANNKTKRKFYPNLKKVKLKSELLKKKSIYTELPTMSDPKSKVSLKMAILP